MLCTTRTPGWSVAWTGSQLLHACLLCPRSSCQVIDMIRPPVVCRVVVRPAHDQQQVPHEQQQQLVLLKKNLEGPIRRSRMASRTLKQNSTLCLLPDCLDSPQ